MIWSLSWFRVNTQGGEDERHLTVDRVANYQKILVCTTLLGSKSRLFSWKKKVMAQQQNLQSNLYHRQRKQQHLSWMYFSRCNLLHADPGVVMHTKFVQELHMHICVPIWHWKLIHMWYDYCIKIISTDKKNVFLSTLSCVENMRGFIFSMIKVTTKPAKLFPWWNNGHVLLNSKTVAISIS